MAKQETVEQFLARGGVITPVPPIHNYRRVSDIPTEDIEAMRERCNADVANSHKEKAKEYQRKYRARMQAMADADQQPQTPKGAP